MNELVDLQNEVSALVGILSFITRRAADLRQSDDDEERTSESPLPIQKHGCELEEADESVDETEFEAPIPSGDEKDVDSIKRSALDRIAEVLARFKTAQGRAAAVEERNQDAKHVTSVMMVEDASGGTATFFCAKNEGLDEDDVEFLRKLEQVYRRIAASGKRTLVKRLLDLMFAHQTPRVKHYANVLANTLEAAARALAPKAALTSQNLEYGRKRCTTRTWKDDHDFDYEIRIASTGDDSGSDIAVDCLTDREGEELVQSAFQGILHHFGTAHVVPQAAIKGLLQGLHSIVRHPRRRPALKGLLRRALHDECRFKKAWSALLYLTRIYHAAVAFEQLASKTGFTAIRFQQIAPSPAAYKPGRLFRQTPVEVLISLGIGSLPDWGDFFSRRDKVKGFLKTTRVQKPIHAEMQLIAHFLQLAQTGKGPNGRVFPYIGCSKKLCFFCATMCSLSPLADEPLHSRGTHLALFSLWALPASLPPSAAELVHRFSKLLQALLHRLLSAPTPPFPTNLLQQSSAALSTTKAVRSERPEYTTMPQVSSRMMLGFGGVTATDQQMEFLPSHESPGYATVLGGNNKYGLNMKIPIYEAEVAKINHGRRKDLLEAMDEMPPVHVTDRRPCRRCGNAASYRCRACWTYYCSSACKKRHAAAHVFSCRLPGRPNDVDFLRLAIRRVSKEIQSEDEERMHNALVNLFADDDLCRTFGFNNCGDRVEVLRLICLYATLLSTLRPAVRGLQEELEAGNLYYFMVRFCELEREVARLSQTKECSCVTWFLDCCSPKTFPIPNRGKDEYEIWIVAIVSAFESLNVTQRMQNKPALSGSQRDVLDLYVTIQPSLWRLPDVTSSLWIKFGFCHSKSFSQREQLAGAYLALAASGATFDEVVSAYQTRSLAGLMRAHAVDVLTLESQGVLPCRPNVSEYKVFRLMVSVEHALSGRFCGCFRVHESRDCHRPFETHFDRECDGNFGFHLTSSWEKWQLLNFYKYIFQRHDYNPRRMAEAVNDSDLGRLEAYLETLDPGMRKRLRLGHRGNVLFPRLKDRMQMRRSRDGVVIHGHLPCDCKLHDVFGPPGISVWSLENMLAALGFLEKDAETETG
ncbi:hypothetical protein MY11210_003387 [Beauveria gryllotalpidicola]